LRFGDHGLGAVAVGVQGVLVAGQCLATCGVIELNQSVGVIVAVGRLAAVEAVGLGQPAGGVVAVVANGSGAGGVPSVSSQSCQIVKELLLFHNVLRAYRRTLSCCPLIPL
jgi:hypothetical protein